MSKKTRFVEVEAPTREEAIHIAIESLGADRKAVIIKILREEKKGLFGKEGFKPVKIRVTLKEDEIFDV